MEYFVEKHSIVREIWGKVDTILFIFAGAAAEFALNKAVDWLYFTGKLPADPLGRLFSTVSYARSIVFAERTSAEKAIDNMSAIHSAVEEKRGKKIPDWAYRDVLFMLIDYSIRSYEVLERKLSFSEKEEVFDVFNRVGQRMQVPGLPSTFAEWNEMRKEHLEKDLRYSHFTEDLFKQYRIHLGPLRYWLLKQVQKLVTPGKVRSLLALPQPYFLNVLITIYKWSRIFRMDYIFKEILLPQQYKTEIKQLDVSIN